MNRFTIPLKTLPLVALVCFLSTGALAQPVNGNFETPLVADGEAHYYPVGNNIGGWDVLGGNILHINTNFAEVPQGVYAFNAGEGTQSVDLTGAEISNAGLENGIRQSFSTIAGQTYYVSFLVGRATVYNGFNGQNNFAGIPVASLSINGGARVNYTNSNSTPGYVNWLQHSFNFVADGASTTFTFYNGSLDTYYVGLDNLVVTSDNPAAPEPGTLALLVPGGLALAGVLRKRKV